MPLVPAFETDRWMDHAEDAPTGERRRFKGIFVFTMGVPKRFLRFVRTSPGVLTLISTILVLAILAAGGAMVFSSEARQRDLDALVSRTEPLSYAAQELYNALSVADTVAATSFLQKNTGAAASVEDYSQAMRSASNAIVKATAGIDSPESRSMELVLIIQESLPEYVQLISNAQTNDRLRNPVGASYLAQGSHLMQETLLPAAQELYERTSEQVTEQQSDLVTPLWFPLSGLVAAVIMLFLAQLWLAALTNRRLNLGYVAATVLMIFALGWASVSSVLIWQAGHQNVTGTVQPLEELTQIRIGVQQSRTSEALGMVQRDYGELQQQNFTERVAQIDTTLEQLRGQVRAPRLIDEAREDLRQWDASHARMVSQIKAGDYSAAVETALATDSHTPSFVSLDKNLNRLISDTRADLRALLVEGRTSAARVTNVVLALTIISAVCVLLGTRPRLQEYF